MINLKENINIIPLSYWKSYPNQNQHYLRTTKLTNLRMNVTSLNIRQGWTPKLIPVLQSSMQVGKKKRGNWIAGVHVE